MHFFFILGPHMDCILNYPRIIYFFTEIFFTISILFVHYTSVVRYSISHYKQLVLYVDYTINSSVPMTLKSLIRLNQQNYSEMICRSYSPKIKAQSIRNKAIISNVKVRQPLQILLRFFFFFFLIITHTHTHTCTSSFSYVTRN